MKLLKEKYGNDIQIVPNLFLGKYGEYMFPDTVTHNLGKFKENIKKN